MSAVLAPRPGVESDINRPLLHRVFSPIRLNRLELPNRVLMGSIHLNMDELGNQYARKAHFYAERARHGVGLIVTAGCSPNREGNTSDEGFGLDRDALIDAHQMITQAVHRAGGRIALQLLHFGREAFHSRLVSASDVRLESNLFKPRALSETDIERTIEDFALAAGRAVQAGYDAIELIFSQGFLVHQFLSPHTNLRTDGWGGSLENRMRLAVEIAKRVRSVVGPDFALLMRVPCLDLLAQGVLPHETVALITALKPYGIDLLNVSIGWHESKVPTIAMVVPRAAYHPVAATIKRLFPELTVCVSNRVNDPRTAEALLAAGVADMVSMARPFLADPELLSKARRNQFESINTCIACNQSCLDYVFTGQPVGCSVNPACSTEQEGRVTPLPGARRVAVVGGGLAGMCTALYLKQRGAQVTLFEGSSSLGGQLRMACRIPKKSEFAQTTRYYATVLAQHQVPTRLGTVVDAQVLGEQPWDHVFVATGSRPKAFAWPDADTVSTLKVLTYEQVLLHEVPVAFPVVVVGAGGVACDVAKYLVAQSQMAHAQSQGFLQAAGAQLSEAAFAGPYQGLLDQSQPAPAVTLLQRSSRKTAHKLGRTTRWIVMGELERAGVQVLRGVDVQQLDADGVQVLHRAQQRMQHVPAATLVVAIGQEPVVDLVRVCAQLGLACSVVGAAAQGGADAQVSITSATVSAYQAAMALS